MGDRAAELSARLRDLDERIRLVKDQLDVLDEPSTLRSIRETNEQIVRFGRDERDDLDKRLRELARERAAVAADLAAVPARVPATPAVALGIPLDPAEHGLKIEFLKPVTDEDRDVVRFLGAESQAAHALERADAGGRPGIPLNPADHGLDIEFPKPVTDEDRDVVRKIAAENHPNLGAILRNPLLLLGTGLLTISLTLAGTYLASTNLQPAQPSPSPAIDLGVTLPSATVDRGHLLPATTITLRGFMGASYDARNQVTGVIVAINVVGLQTGVASISGVVSGPDGFSQPFTMKTNEPAPPQTGQTQPRVDWAVRLVPASSPGRYTTRITDISLPDQYQPASGTRTAEGYVFTSLDGSTFPTLDVVATR